MKHFKLLALILSLLLVSCSKPNNSSESLDSLESITESIESEESNESIQDESESESESFVESESESESVSESESEEESTSEYIPPVPGGYGLENDPINTDPVAKNYYKNISKTSKGTTLLNELYNLIHPSKCTTGYSSVWNYLENCDANPDNPSSGQITAYYRGTPSSRSSMNKEHVWPNSRGGSCVEGDPHMTRPTLNADNSSRGNSFYVEGMAHSQNGWDPKADGMNEMYRGDCARIIFYCAVQEKGQLSLSNNPNDSTSKRTMGKLTDLIKWNYEYPINKFERFRNEVLNGQRSVNGSNYKFNRNPFIDDRNLVCRIWGDTNSETQRLCAIYSKTTAPTRLELNYSEYKLAQGGTVTLAISEFAPADAVTTVNWSSSNSTVATVNSNGLVSAKSDGEAIITATSTVDPNVKATCKIIVKTEPVEMTNINVSPSAISIQEGKTASITVNPVPTNSYPRPSYSYRSLDTNVATVSSTGVVTAVLEGTTKIEVSASQNSINVSKTIDVTVTPKPNSVTVTQDEFTELNDSLDEYISYTTGQGGGTHVPQVIDGVIRLYQNSSGGGYITIKGNKATILSVTIGTGMSTTIAYTLDNGQRVNAGNLSAGSKFTLDNLSNKSVTFTCLGADKTHRLYVNYLSVTYKID